MSCASGDRSLTLATTRSASPCREVRIASCEIATKSVAASIERNSVSMTRAGNLADGPTRDRMGEGVDPRPASQEEPAPTTVDLRRLPGERRATDDIGVEARQGFPPEAVDRRLS